MSAKLLTKDQRLVVGVTKPRSSYSRTIGVWSQIKGIDEVGWGYTPPLGQTIWLLDVRVYFSPDRTAEGDQINFGIHVGHTKPKDADELKAWDPVIPIYMPDGRLTYFVQTQKSESMSWPMQRLFTGNEIRFGTWVSGSLTVGICEMWTFFEISEG